ncbi:hypothetical protein EJ04DRAFT_535938 [Polyplosphaeria fusca]|uniref:ABM domain-containing protein n=1 Tax=Polyplosphaeria fusca TaxID=682080 RepID=A0A9P4QRQ5_9PLEO|nr:hypothetical protein EJ04DRAFT_535938 [Polyplosphaeria fusca]
MVYTIVVHLHANDSTSDVAKLKAKLVEASNVYSRDKETLSWFVMQDVGDERKFTIVERYLKEESQKYHLENPYWKTFDPYVNPLLDKPMDLRRCNELDTGAAAAAGAHVHEDARGDVSLGSMYSGAV